MTDEYGRIHTDGSRSGGQPLDDSVEAKALALVNEVLTYDGDDEFRATALDFGSELLFAVIGLETQPHATNAVFEVKLRGHTRKVTVT